MDTTVCCMIQEKHTPNVQDVINEISDSLDVRGVHVYNEDEVRDMEGVNDFNTVVSISHWDKLEMDEIVGYFSDENDISRDVWVLRSDEYPSTNNVCDPNPENWYYQTDFVIVE